MIGKFPSPPSPAITASPTPELNEGILAEIAVDGSPCYLPAAGNLWTVDFLSNTVYRLDETAS